MRHLATRVATQPAPVPRLHESRTWRSPDAEAAAWPPQAAQMVAVACAQGRWWRLSDLLTGSGSLTRRRRHLGLLMRLCAGLRLLEVRARLCLLCERLERDPVLLVTVTVALVNLPDGFGLALVGLLVLVILVLLVLPPQGLQQRLLQGRLLLQVEPGVAAAAAAAAASGRRGGLRGRRATRALGVRQLPTVHLLLHLAQRGHEGVFYVLPQLVAACRIVRLHERSHAGFFCGRPCFGSLPAAEVREQRLPEALRVAALVECAEHLLRGLH
mmetsp:Transcript_60820/g.156768  ORF Transcript_60820/g.156768 Transcript_60820/m.156768 type:complete len:271 (-) Transcript_60820:907-1719(-)